MLSPIRTNLSQKLTDKGYRQRFFRGKAQDEIAYNVRRFRKMRQLNQSELAALCGTKQSAISRLEQADYSRWNISTLWKIADALDLRVRVSIDDATNAITEHQERDLAEQIAAHQATQPVILTNNAWAPDMTYNFAISQDLQTLNLSRVPRNVLNVVVSGEGQGICISNP